MNQVPEEDLLGYTLGALEADEQEQIESLVREDDHVAADVELIRKSLLPLDRLAPATRPRAGLARRVCECIAAVPLQTAGAVEPASRQRGNWFTDRRELAGGGGRASVMDFAIAAGVMLLLAAIIVPALNHSRHQSRILACQDNLRTVGMSLLDYSNLQGGRHLAIPRDENLGFAGIVAPTLKEGGFLENDNLFLCADRGSGDRSPLVVPSLNQIRNADGPGLVRLQRQAGGDYAFCLGQLVDGRYSAPRNESRPWYVLLADKPAAGQPGRASANHGSSGQNVFFEDGHVQLLRTPVVNDDSIYENDRGAVAPGLHFADNVVASSGVTIMQPDAIRAD